MTGGVSAVTVAVTGGSGAATYEGERITASTPAVFWRELGERAGDRMLHLLPPGLRPDASAVLAAARVSPAAVATVGRLRYRGGSLSPRLTRWETLRYLDLPAGSLIVSGAALSRAAERIGRSWDECWTRDLALSTSRDGMVATTDVVIADVDGTPPGSLRLPFARAGLTVPEDRSAPYVLIYGQLSASTSLYFDGLPPDLFARLRFLEPGDLFSDLPWLAAASLVVVVRGFEHIVATGAIDLVEELGTPMVWFTDDDFAALGSEITRLGYYTGDAVRSFAKRMNAIGVTSVNLAQALADYHQNIILFPCVLDRDLWALRPSGPAEPRYAGVFGGPFRRRSFETHALPAARSLGLNIVAGSNLAPATGLSETVPYRTDFQRFIFEWQRLAPAVLLHPYSDTVNIANKSPGSLLAAAYLRAVPVVGNEPAYEGVGPDQGVLKAGTDPADWLAQLNAALDPATRPALLERLDRWVEATFDPESARPAVSSLFDLAASGGDTAAGLRLAAAMASQTLQRALPRQPAWRRHLARLRLSLERRLALRRRV